MSTSPEIAQKKANPALSSSDMPAPEQSNPPAPLNTPMQPTNPQNQQTESSAPENQETSSSVPEVNPPEPDDPKQPTNPQKQEKLQSAPEITPEEAVATPLNPPQLGNSAQTTPETTDQNQQNSDQTETPKKDSTASITTDPQNEIPKQDSTAPNPQTETPKQNEAQEQDSTNVNTPSQPDSSAETTSETTDRNQQKSDQTETPNKDSTTTEPQNETPKQDSTTTTEPQNETPKQDSTTATDPQTETPKQNEAQRQDSTNVNTHSQLESSAQTTSETTDIQQKSDQTETPNKDSTTTEPQNETPKQDSTTPPDPLTETPNENEAHKQDSTNVNAPPETDITDTHPKKMSMCTPPAGIFGSKEKKSQPKNTSGKDEHSKSTESRKPIVAPDVIPDDFSASEEEYKNILADIRYIDELNSLHTYKGQAISLVAEANQAERKLDELRHVGTREEFRNLKKEVTKLKLKILSQQKYAADEKDPYKFHLAATRVSKTKQKSIPELLRKKMPQLYKSWRFENSAEVKYFESLFSGLSRELKLCLLCFSVFPEDAIIKKRLMVYWWIAEGFTPPIPQDDMTRQQIAEGRTAEEFADEYFEKLTKMGLIEPVNKKRSLFVGCYRLHPFVRLALIMMAEKANFFNFDEEGNPTEISSDTFQACLMGRGLINYQDLQTGVVRIQDLEKTHAVFNVNEPILDVNPEWFSMMKNLHVLYLGSWKVSDTDHIQVEKSNFLDGLSNMVHLKFFSLQGVSKIMKLPKSIEKLSSLIIMDLRACHNLQSIPEGIRFLKNLTYLDISKCYLLEHMPKGLAMLSNLQVLKGFVAGKVQDKHTCSLDDLAKLEKLIKLSIYTGLGEFPTEKDLNALQNFKVLKKLTMAWGGASLHTKSKEDSEPPKPDEKKKAYESKQTFRMSLAKLEKLDLKSFPKIDTPSWLTPSSLKSLKKLYIRGGKFSDLGQYQYFYKTGMEGSPKTTWKVEILRLKYLSELKMDWRELQGLFPDLIYLEKFNCPKLSLFPSDEYGVWINKDKLKQKQV